MLMYSLMNTPSVNSLDGYIHFIELQIFSAKVNTNMYKDIIQLFGQEQDAFVTSKDSDQTLGLF